MRYLAHRGAWTEPSDKNSMAALRRALDSGHGVETDFRDAGGELVISHDLPGSSSPLASSFFMLEGASVLPLALNVKADGLAHLMLASIKKWNLSNCFAFDMSVPDMREYRAIGVSYFTRHSDLEPVPALYDDADGVWLDSFTDHWFDHEVIEGHLQAGKKVAVVSEELHGRSPAPLWERLAEWRRRPIIASAEDRLYLCTDYPERAEQVMAAIV